MPLWMHRRYLDENDGDGGDGGGSGDDKSKGITEVQGQVSTLTEQVKLLAQGYSNIDSLVKGLSEKLGGIDELKGALDELKSGGGGKGLGKTLPDDTDLDTLSRRELIALIESRLSGNIEKSLQPIKEGIEKAFSRMDETEAMSAVSAAKERHKDFMEWKGEMGAILKANPELSVSRAYLLARAENPTKAAELDEKFKPKEKGGDFTGGFFPTSSRTVRSTKMNPSQAAEAAWDSVMASLGSGAEDSITHH